MSALASDVFSWAAHGGACIERAPQGVQPSRQTAPFSLMTVALDMLDGTDELTVPMLCKHMTRSQAKSVVARLVHKRLLVPGPQRACAGRSRVYRKAPGYRRPDTVPHGERPQRIADAYRGMAFTARDVMALLRVERFVARNAIATLIGRGEVRGTRSRLTPGQEQLYEFVRS